MLEFVKMHGLGNDFVVIDARRRPVKLTPEQTRRIADRRFGVGCDQLIVLETSPRADARMLIYNPDGSESGACGNATRCIGQTLMRESGGTSATIETAAGVLAASGDLERITVDMGAPRLGWRDIPLAREAVDTARVPFDPSQLAAGLPAWFGAVNMGNPHAVFFVGDVEAHRLERVGPLLERDPLFPERANISLVAVAARNRLIQKVWERGAGLTLACGSGACAALVAAHRAGLADRKATVCLPGGDLLIEWTQDNRVLMTGGAATSFRGQIDGSLLEIAGRE